MNMCKHTLYNIDYDLYLKTVDKINNINYLLNKFNVNETK